MAEERGRESLWRGTRLANRNGPMAAQDRRGTMKRLHLHGTFAIVLLASMAACSTWAASLPECATVARDVAGDTLAIAADGRSCTVRLIDVDTPQAYQTANQNRDAKRPRGPSCATRPRAVCPATTLAWARSPARLWPAERRERTGPRRPTHWPGVSSASCRCAASVWGPARQLS